MLKNSACLLLLLVIFQSLQAQNKFTISGYTNEKGSQENLPGAIVYVPKLKAGTTSNNYGFFSITLPQDSVEIIFSYVGFMSPKLNLCLDKDVNFNVELGTVDLQEVTVTAEQSKRVSQETQMST